MILLPEWLHRLNYVQTCFSYPSTPPPLSNLLKSTCSTCSAFKIFQNIQNCNRHQSAQDAQAPKVFFLSGFHLWFLAFCTNMREEFVVRFPLAPHQFENKWTTKHWSYNTIWPTYFLACFGYGVWWNEFCYMMLYVVPLSQKSFPSMQVLPGLISISILMETPGTVGKKLGPCFYFLKPSKKRAF